MPESDTDEGSRSPDQGQQAPRSRTGWRFFPDASGPANIQLESNAKLTIQALDALGENFEKIMTGFIDFLLLNEKGFHRQLRSNHPL